MSVNVEFRTVKPGSDALLAEAWELKERIREGEGFLKQKRGFFTRAYRQSTVYCFVTASGELIGFASTRSDGYILFLAVSPDHRQEGFGERLIAQVADKHATVTCHARTRNDKALTFYDRLGFDIIRRINNYYEDGGDAVFLRLGEPERLTDRLSNFLKH